MTTAREIIQEVAPHLADLSADVLFGDVWERPGLSKRDRSLITVATLIALYRTGQLPSNQNNAGPSSSGTILASAALESPKRKSER